MRNYIITLTLICFFQYACGQYPNFWLVSKNGFLDFNSSPPSYVKLPNGFYTEGRSTDLHYSFIASKLNGERRAFGSYYERDRRSGIDPILCFNKGYDTLPIQFSIPNNSIPQFASLSIRSSIPEHLAFNNGNLFQTVQYDDQVLIEDRDGIMRFNYVNDTARLDHVGLYRKIPADEHEQLVFRDDSTFYAMYIAWPSDSAIFELKYRIYNLLGELLDSSDIQFRNKVNNETNLQVTWVISANRSSQFSLIIREGDDYDDLNAYFFKISNDSINLIKKHFIAKSLNNPEIQGACYSPNDSFLYVSYHNGAPDYQTKLERLSIHSENQEELLSLGDYDVLKSLATAPNGKVYFHYHKENEIDVLDFIGQIDYPDSKPELILNRFFDNDVYYSKSYYGGFEPTTIIGIPQLRFKAKQKNCRDSFISCFSYSDEPFIHFNWELFTLDTVLVESKKGERVKLTPPKTGTYLVRLNGQDQYGKNSWCWLEVEFKKPFNFNPQSTNPRGYCAHNEIALHTNYQKDLSTDILHFTWQFGKNNNIVLTAIGDSILPVFKDTGLFDLKLLAQLNNCTDSIIISDYLTVHSGPKPGFGLSNDSLCSNNQILITDSASGPVDSSTFIWSDGQQFNGGGVHTRTFEKTGNYTVTQQLMGGRKPNVCQSSLQKSVHVMRGLSQNDSPNLKLATVNEPNVVTLYWQPLKGIAEHHIYKNSNWTFSAKATDSFYYDSMANTNSTSYQYTVLAIDSCGQKSGLSNNANNILLFVENENNSVAHLTWNAYNKWPNGVKEYQLESKLPGSSWGIIEGLSATSYSDFRILNLAVDTIYYRIKAIEQSGNEQISLSNEVATYTKSTLFVPNAFTPNNDGVNDVFKVGGFGLTSFTCSIYAHNGQLVAFSNNPDNIWDGKSSVNLKDYPAGAYSYVIKATTVQNEDSILTGNVVLIR
ncbi:MAG: gliding motility-associated C-terminal domain-containing protein [Bacteroidetes bacterium]|nr:gliding motility-associated C-terminal domain-containing protein [Bacteroidota bacterium]